MKILEFHRMFNLHWLIENPILHGNHVPVPKTFKESYAFSYFGSLRQTSNVFSQIIFVVVHGYYFRSCSSIILSAIFSPYSSWNQIIIFKIKIWCLSMWAPAQASLWGTRCNQIQWCVKEAPLVMGTCCVSSSLIHNHPN